MEISYKIYTKILVRLTKAVFLLLKGAIIDLKVSYEFGRYIALFKPGVWDRLLAPGALAFLTIACVFQHF